MLQLVETAQVLYICWCRKVASLGQERPEAFTQCKFQLKGKVHSLFSCDNSLCGCAGKYYCQPGLWQQISTAFAAKIKAVQPAA